jgi:N-methylhydantoinase A
VSFGQLAEGFMKSNAGNGGREDKRDAYFGPTIGDRETRVLPRSGLVGRTLAGPIVIEEFDTTIVVPPGWKAALDKYGNVKLESIK